MSQHMSAAQLALAKCLKAENAGCPADVAALAYEAAQSLPSMRLLLAGPPCFSVYGARGQCASTAGNPETEPRGRYLNGIRPRTDWKCVSLRLGCRRWRELNCRVSAWRMMSHISIG